MAGPDGDSADDHDSTDEQSAALATASWTAQMSRARACVKDQQEQELLVPLTPRGASGVGAGIGEQRDPAVAIQDALPKASAAATAVGEREGEEVVERVRRWLGGLYSAVCANPPSEAQIGVMLTRFKGRELYLLRLVQAKYGGTTEHFFAHELDGLGAPIKRVPVLGVEAEVNDETEDGSTHAVSCDEHEPI